MISDKHKELLLNIDPLFKGHNFNYLDYEYCANPVCLESPDDYDCPFVCDLAGEETLEISKRYFMNLRRGFLPRPGFVWVSIDYSQIELRIAANLSGEKVWIDSFLAGEDLHRNTAKMCFKTEDPTDKQRKMSKGFNFGALYGGGAKALALNLNIPLSEAQEGLTYWKEGVPTLEAWLRAVSAQARKVGYASSYFGRRRYLQPYYNPTKPMTSEEKKLEAAKADRFAKNHVVQGCLSYNTRILTNTGYHKIGELHEGIKKADTVWDGFGWRTFYTLERGVAKRVNIHLENGAILEVDNRHKLFINVGRDGIAAQEKHIDELLIGDKVSRLKYTEEIEFDNAFEPIKFQTSSISKPVHLTTAWKWLGYYLIKGNINKAMLRLFFHKDKQSKLIKEYIRDCKKHLKCAYPRELKSGGKNNPEIEIMVTGGKLWQFIKTYTQAESGKVPEKAFEATLENRRAFIQGIEEAYATSKRANINHENEDFIRDLQKLYQTVGVPMKVFNSGTKSWFLSPESPLKLKERKNGFSDSEIIKIERLRISETTYTLSVNHIDHRFIADGHLHKNTAADILKISMLNARKLIKEKGWEEDVNMLLTVHDEIDFEVRETKLDEIVPALRDKMEIKLSKWPVALTVDVEVAKDWGSVSKYIQGTVTMSEEARYAEAPYILIPKRLDEEEVGILEAILKEHKGLVPVRMGYDSHVFEMTVTDAQAFQNTLKSKGLI